jgi:hypothetical protein
MLEKPSSLLHYEGTIHSLALGALGSTLVMPRSEPFNFCHVTVTVIPLMWPYRSQSDISRRLSTYAHTPHLCRGS